MEKKQETSKGKLLFLQMLSTCIISIAGIITLVVLQYGMPLFCDNWTTPLPHALDFLFNVEQLFDTSTAQGAADYAKYVVRNGDTLSVTWGYMVPFFVANLASNLVNYYFNKKYTFKSSAPRWHFVAYLVFVILVIVGSTWMQGILYPWFMDHGFGSWSRFACFLPPATMQATLFFFAQVILLPVDENYEEIEPAPILWLKKKLGMRSAESAEA